MARRPGVCPKNGSWYSEAGGKARYFGRVSDTSKTEALSRLWMSLAEDESPKPKAQNPEPEPEAQHPHPAPLAVSCQEPEVQSITFQALADAYLEWIEANRSGALHREAKRHVGRWNAMFGTMTVDEIRGDDLEAFRARLLDGGHARLYVQKHATTIKAMLNRGVRLKLLPRGFKPFEGVEGLRVEPKALLESDLPTPGEVQKLFAHAKTEFGAMLRVYYHTGARTHELIEARCGDYQPKAKALVMAKHKRSHTLREYRPRTILLNDEANEIIEAKCKSGNNLIFPNRAGRPFTSASLGDMFARLRAKADIRGHITIYSLRHLWISEMLMTGHDALLVAKMAGTSVKMVETVYGHFRHQALMEALVTLDKARAVHRR